MKSSTMDAKRWLAILTGIALMFGSACFAGPWMNVIGKVSGWTGLPQYESQIPKLQWYGTVWESLTIALLLIAAFVLGLGKRVPSNEVTPVWGAVVLNYLIRLALCIIGAITVLFVLGVMACFHTH